MLSCLYTLDEDRNLEYIGPSVDIRFVTSSGSTFTVNSGVQAPVFKFWPDVNPSWDIDVS